jgi:penicillin amidase
VSEAAAALVVRRRRTQLAGGLALVAVLLLGIGASLSRLRENAAIRAAFPESEGRLAAAGISAPVDVFRDANGVPHIRARNQADAFFALGFVHAQDRLAQMLWLQRLARGRTAEIVGREGLPADRLARILDLGGLAERKFAELDRGTRALLVAYARGVNARIERIRDGQAAAPVAAQRRALPLEDWRAEDSLAVLELYAWGLADSLEVSLVLSDLIERLGGFGARPFFPPRAGDAAAPDWQPLPLTASESDALGGLRRAAHLSGRSLGSSAFVVGGAHTRSGRPILAGDSHLEPTWPPLLHVVHVQGGGLDVAGSTLPGVPIVWTGRNPQIAWAVTNARAVTVDLYTETLHPADPARYHDGRGWSELEERVEVLRVRGDDDETLSVRSTRHGPLLDPLLGQERSPLAISWAGSRVAAAGGLPAWLAVARASGEGELISALERVGEPAVAVVYAGADGAAGMQVAGWIPRHALSTGLVPLPGRARWYDWQGPVDFAQLPRERLAAGRGWAIAADNSFVTGADGAAAEWLWRSGERAQRIDALLREATGEGPLELREVALLQADVGEPRARSLVKSALVLAERGERLPPEANELIGLLREWDGRSTPDSVGAAAFHVFLSCLTEELFERHLGEDLTRRYLALPFVDPGQVVFGIVNAAAERDAGGGWADPVVVGSAVRASLREAWLQLSYRLGSNRRRWNWGGLHQLRFRPFGGAAPRDAELAVLGPFAAGGSGSTVYTAEYAEGGDYDVLLASTYRFAIDTAAMDQALVALAPGQSEHPRHPHASDGLERWREGRSGLLATSPLLVEELSSSRLVLEPVAER